MDTRRWPLVTVRFPAVVTPGGYEALFRYYCSLCSLGEPVAWIIDFQRYDPVTSSAELRREAARVFRMFQQELRQVTISEARVVENPLSRGVLVAFDWLTGSKWPVHHVATLAEAELWTRRQLEAKSIFLNLGH